MNDPRHPVQPAPVPPAAAPRPNGGVPNPSAPRPLGTATPGHAPQQARPLHAPQPHATQPHAPQPHATQPHATHAAQRPMHAPQPHAPVGAPPPPLPASSLPRAGNPGTINPAARKPAAVEEEAISLVEDDDLDGDGAVAAAPHVSKIKFGADSGPKKHDFTRALKQGGIGAVRVRTFHAKLSDQGLEYLDDAINVWLDAHPEVDVKFVTSNIGMFDGKFKDLALIMNVWY